MEETAWDTALAPHPAGCCKDRAAARPDPCDGREVGHFCGALPVLGRLGLGWLRKGWGEWDLLATMVVLK